MPDTGSAIQLEYLTGRYRYVGLEITYPDGSVRVLTKQIVDRFILIERNNRRRVKPDADPISEKVDFIGKCIAQKWLCCICSVFMDPLDFKTEMRVSVEHNPAISVCNEHSRRTVYGAHMKCNFAKAASHDTTRAAKIKRVSKDEDRHKASMQAKATLSREVYKRQRREKGSRLKSSRVIKSNPEIASRPLGNWPKRKFPSATRKASR